MYALRNSLSSDKSPFINFYNNLQSSTSSYKQNPNPSWLDIPTFIASVLANMFGLPFTQNNLVPNFPPTLPPTVTEAPITTTTTEATTTTSIPENIQSDKFSATVMQSDIISSQQVLSGYLDSISETKEPLADTPVDPSNSYYGEGSLDDIQFVLNNGKERKRRQNPFSSSGTKCATQLTVQ